MIGTNGYGEQNKRGEQLVHFAECNQLHVMNIYFKKQASRKRAWKSPDRNEKNEIDYILANRK